MKRFLLKQPDPMLGGNTAPVDLDQPEEILVLLFAATEKLRLLHPLGAQRVHVQVAVADVAEEVDLEAGMAALEHLVHLRDELIELAHRHRDVVLMRKPAMEDALRGAFAD